MAFAANMRDEVRDLHDVAGALQAQAGMKQQTFVAQSGSGCLNPWDTQQSRISTPDGVAPTMAGADGLGGRNPAGLVITAGFSAGAAPTAGPTSPLPNASPAQRVAFGEEERRSGADTRPQAGVAECSRFRRVPSVLCLNDQGGQRMDLCENKSGTLRARMDGHPPLVMATQQGGAEIGVDVCPTITAAAGLSGNNQPVLMFDNHSQDSRYNGPLEVAPSVQSAYGTGGNNTPIIAQDSEAICIAGNIIDRQPQNGGNGFGYQSDVAYTITATDKHAVYQNAKGLFTQKDVASTQCARQYKDATDLVHVYGQADYSNYAEGVSTLRASGGSNGGGSENLVTESSTSRKLIRRLTPLECERLQGFPDGWTDIPGASDSARYKALGNSVAIPCAEHVLRGVAYYLQLGDEDNTGYA